MHIAIFILAVLVLLSGIVSARYQKVELLRNNTVEESKVLSQQEQNNFDEGNEIDLEFKKNEENDEIKKENELVSPTPTPLPTQTQLAVILTGFIYPGSKITFASDSTLVLESNGNVDDITNWYKEKIKSGSYNAKSFVSTSSNGNVLNKMAGSNKETEISVEISKNSNSNNVSINVSTIK